MSNDPCCREPQGIYAQPVVISPPGMQNPSNARQAIWHLGRMIDLLVFPTAEGWRAGENVVNHDGRHDRGDPLILKVRGVIQANGATGETIEGIEATHEEGEVIVHVDSHDPINLAAARAYPTVFPNGLRIVGPDDWGTDGLHNFPMAFRFRGRDWKVLRVKEQVEGGDVSPDLEGAIYRCECGLWRQTVHELDAKTNVPAWGPDIPA